MEQVEFHVGLGETDERVYYIVDGSKDSRLLLTEGRTYKFIIETPGHPFYITDDPFGGPKDPKATDPKVQKMDRGELIYTPGKEAVSMNLYYQCASHPKMGYKIWVSPAQ
jgi:hypothetical protein